MGENESGGWTFDSHFPRGGVVKTDCGSAAPDETNTENDRSASRPSPPPTLRTSAAIRYLLRVMHRKALRWRKLAQRAPSPRAAESGRAGDGGTAPTADGQPSSEPEEYRPSCRCDRFGDGGGSGDRVLLVRSQRDCHRFDRRRDWQRYCPEIGLTCRPRPRALLTAFFAVGLSVTVLVFMVLALFVILLMPERAAKGRFGAASTSSAFLRSRSAAAGFEEDGKPGVFQHFHLTKSDPTRRHQRQLASADGDEDNRQAGSLTALPHDDSSINSTDTGDMEEIDQFYEDGVSKRRRTYFYPKCGCHRELVVEEAELRPDALSTCDGFATLRGRHQKVVSFSLFRNNNNNNNNSSSSSSSSSMRAYLEGVRANAELLAELYPGWVMRVYHDVDVDGDGGSGDPEGAAALMCDVVCGRDDVDMCHVADLHSLGDVRGTFGMLWRFLVLGDPTVETFVVRDLDSLINRREADAVAQWLRSGARFHVMRDAPMHNALFMGGLWGAHNYHPSRRTPTVASGDAVESDTYIDSGRSRNGIDSQTKERVASGHPNSESDTYESQARAWLHRILVAADGLGYKGLDQRVLNEVLGPVVQTRSEGHASTSSRQHANHLISHDSYTCGNFPESQPWPTERQGREFVGSPSLLFPAMRVPEQCPWECRPPDHKDWLYC